MCCISEQDAGLESLGAIISRQKQIALDIGNEVDDQTGTCTVFLSTFVRLSACYCIIIGVLGVRLIPY